jgi:segregation and condensation protein B
MLNPEEAKLAELAAIEMTEPPALTRDYEALERNHLRIIEALLFASAEPLDEEAFARVLPQGADIPALLNALVDEYSSRGVNLARVAGKWQFRTAGDLAFLLRKETVEPHKLSRAAIETLAIIAYHQPVTRAEIEAIRGVMVSKGTLDSLLEMGWVRIRGRRRTPGRPVTYGTTDAFLTHFGLDDVSDLPGADELRAAGFLESVPPAAVSVPQPSQALAPDEDPYDAEEQAENLSEPPQDE